MKRELKGDIVNGMNSMLVCGNRAIPDEEGTESLN